MNDELCILETNFCLNIRMMGSLAAKRQVMRKRARVTCPSARSQSGENGAYALVRPVMAQEPTPGLVTASLR